MKASGGLSSESSSLFPQPAPPAPRNTVSLSGNSNATGSNHKINEKLLRNKDVNDFMVALDDYAPTLPTEVAYYYLADKLMADILFDARQFNLLRQQSNNPRVKRKAEADASTLQFDDLVRSLRMRGVHIHRPAAPRDADTSSSAATAPSAVAVAASERDGGEGAT